MDEKKLSRKDFVRGAAVATIGAVGVTAAINKIKWGIPHKDPQGEETVRHFPQMKTVPREGDKIDPLIRMQDELRRALAKPLEKRKWMMVIDTRKCVGCHACTVACIAENKLPPAVVYRPVLKTEFGKYPNLALRFTPRPCMQCDKPPCVPVCPVNATWKRADGIVAIDYDQCIGCGYCVTACPYNARTRDLGEHYTDNTPAVQPYEKQPNHEYGKSWNRENHASPVGNARKCQFCVHRLEKGELPQCVTTCISRANYFGDANDPDSLVVQKAASSNSMKLLEEKGTKPQVVYLI